MIRQYILEQSAIDQMDITFSTQYEMGIIIRFPNGSTYEEEYETDPYLNKKVESYMKYGAYGKAYAYLKDHGHQLESHKLR